MQVKGVALYVQHPLLHPDRRLLIAEPGRGEGPAGVDVDLLPLVHADDKHRRAHAQFLQDGGRVSQIAGVAVVHGNQHRLVRHGAAVLHIVHQLGEGHGMEPRVPQGRHLLPEPGHGDDRANRALRGKVVVHQNRQGAAAPPLRHI